MPRTYKAARYAKYDTYQRGLGSIVYNFFDKKTGSQATVTSKARVSVNEELAQELRKTVIKTSKEVKSMPGLKIIFGSRLNWNGVIIFF